MEWATRLMESFGYPGIILIVALENLFSPIPSEVVLPFAGFLTTSGSLNLVGVIIAATLGSVLGALALYAVGRILGRERIYQIVRRFGRYLTIRDENVKQAEDWFSRYGGWTVFFCRMVPILRSLISIPAGLTEMRLAPFIAYTTAGTLLWNIFLVGVGATLGAAWPIVATWVGYYQDTVIIAGALAAGVLLWLRLRKRWRGK